jgi:anti-anti-sigma regulatory factor
MSFELTVAAKRDPNERSGPVSSLVPSSCTAIALNGTLDDEAVRAVLKTVSELATRDADSILVQMEDVDGGKAECLTSLARGLMTLRADGTNVQVACRDEAFYAKMAGTVDSRDWLMSSSASDPHVPRRALHVDGTDRRSSAAE